MRNPRRSTPTFNPVVANLLMLLIFLGGLAGLWRMAKEKSGTTRIAGST